MRNYNFILAKQIINSTENLVSASLGMHEDWSWTAQDVWNKEDGYTHPLSDNVKEIYDEYQEKCKNDELPIFIQAPKDMLPEDTIDGQICNPDLDKYRNNFLGDIIGSKWATPVIKLTFEDDSTKTFYCFTGDTKSDALETIEQEMIWTDVK